MKPVYEIKFLGSDDFDELPVNETNGSDISDSLGFFNPVTNRVYIRHTGIKELDKYLLEHEFEHLLEDEATDVDENGIRHKKLFKDIFKPFVNPLNIPIPGLRHEKKQSQEDQMAQQQQQLMASFGNLGMGLPGSGQSQPIAGSSFSPTNPQQSGQGGLNVGLNQQSINPLADPYSKYGQAQGRIFNF